MFLSSFVSAQMLHPDKPDSGKKCAICHFQWVYPFYTEHRDGELVPQPAEKMVATAEMCFSCHDGSIADSRKIVFHDPGHREGVLPSEKITIPEDFPLDDGGRLQCSTCHTPHALASEAGVGVEVFLRSSDRESDLCRTCHRDKEGGPAKGNHSIAVSAKKQPAEIVGHGGRFGDAMPNEGSMTSFWSFLQKIQHDPFYVYPVMDTVPPCQAGRALMREAIPLIYGHRTPECPTGGVPVLR
jgi:hypothetical protein